MTGMPRPRHDGRIISFWAAAGLIKSFSGGGLFASAAVLTTPFFASVLVGAVGWILFATFTGLPVSQPSPSPSELKEGRQQDGQAVPDQGTDLHDP